MTPNKIKPVRAFAAINQYNHIHLSRIYNQRCNAESTASALSGGYVQEVEIRSVDNEPTVTLPASDFEHLLNCLANQKFIHDVNADGISEGIDTVRAIQKENQRIIDKAWREGMDLLNAYMKNEKEKA